MKTITTSPSPFISALGFDPRALIHSLQSRGLVSFRAERVQRRPYGRRNPFTDCRGVTRRGHNHLVTRQRIKLVKDQKVPELIGLSQEEQALALRIVKAVCREYNVTHGMLAAQLKVAELTWPRYLAMYLLSEAGLNNRKAAMVIGRTPSMISQTRIHLLDQLEVNPEAGKVIERFKQQLGITSRKGLTV